MINPFLTTKLRNYKKMNCKGNTVVPNIIESEQFFHDDCENISKRF